MSTAKKTLIADSTQIQSFLDCPTFWNLSHRQHLANKIQPPKDAMIKGTYGHKLSELYYKDRANGIFFPQALKSALEHNIDAETNCKCLHPSSAHRQFLGHWVCSLCNGTESYFHQFDPQPFPLSQTLRNEVRDRFQMYVMTHSSNDFQPHNAESVEVGFSELIYEDSDHLFILEGKIDLLARYAEENIIVDHKWQDRATNLYKKAVQFRNYSMISGRKLMVINYVRMAPSAQKPFERSLISFSSDEHRWWKGELVKIYFGMLRSIESNFTLDNDHKWNHCKGDYGRPCEFSEICEERDQERIKLMKIQQNFVKKAEWKPW